MITELFPIVSTTDMTRALGFYRDLLGGIITFAFPGPDGTPGYVGLEIGSSHIGIGLSPDLKGGPPPWPISLWVYSDDCDATVARIRAAGERITEEPTDQAWGERVARCLDPDGNEIIIGQRAGS